MVFSMPYLQGTRTFSPERSDPNLKAFGINVLKTVADLHSKILDAYPPLPGAIFFIFIQFLVNFGEISGWRPLSC